MDELPVLYEDDHYLAVHKPVGVLVHKTPLERDPAAKFAVQILRKQVGYKVYPLHRIDRPTSGILLFAKNQLAASALQPQFAGTGIKKYYLSIVRGYLPEAHGLIDHPLAKDLVHELQPAVTEYWRLSETEIPYASSNRYATSRYALVKVYPHTGRMHQIRRHFAHIRHYVIGDRTHGDNKQNRFFERHFNMHLMLLHAWKMEFSHPFLLKDIKITARPPEHFEEMASKLGWKLTNFNY
ncbi:tRNA pseudouridine65 synthase [Cyclobacterium lianum]|uniref:tRNA pseudouridine synthase C n=1 Tax=Cyclobacterium lianum TaxID=388280 RepID=A0A1M7LYX9_9BACT|nr:pseudouridine synthase [Cyclobacterium lianum]SHM83600.1 tRNA pseudouridine65 synthase [Cyclobacterium lianum]